MSAAYEPWVARDRHLVAIAVGTAAAAWWGGTHEPRRHVVLIAALLAIGLGIRWRRGSSCAGLAAVAVVCAVAAAFVSHRSWQEVRSPRLGPVSGWVTMVGDPEPVGAGVRVVVEVDQQRFTALVYGGDAGRLRRRQAGEQVVIVGERVPLRPTRARRAQVRHVVGDLDVEQVGDHLPGSPLSESANRVRGLLRAGAERTMGATDASLFTGLVIGDDTRQPRPLIDAFRAAGLSHLTAVSGQNVAYAIAVVAALLRRLRPVPRLATTWAVIGWFVVLTRVEPSVVRAGVMAGLSALGFALGRERSPLRMLALAVTSLVLVDPLLVWSVGFWLSVTATWGVTAVAPRIERRLGRPRWLAAPLSVTLGAQVGVALPSWLVFERMPALGIGANLLAVPVAGLVMLIGIPAAIAAAVLPEPLAQLVMLVPAVGTRWVRLVAEHAARLEPHGAAALAVWVAQTALLGGLVIHRRVQARDTDARR